MGAADVPAGQVGAADVPAGPIGAAVDVGSNSIHLLVAQVTGGGISQLHEESVLVGLGDVVDDEGTLPAAVRAEVVASLLGYRSVAHDHGAQMVTFVGTEPLRRASNSTELIAEVRRATGLALHVVTDHTEAELTYLGVTAGRTPAETLLIVDIGGGSTEIVLASPGEPLLVRSLPSGSARLGVGIVHNDPPTSSEFDRLRMGALGLVRELPLARPTRVVFVGGTGTNLVHLVPLSRAGLEEAHGMLTSLSESELVERYMVHARRARQLPAGAAIVEALLAHYGLESAEASQASLRDGAILAAATYGAEWPARLPELLG